MSLLLAVQGGGPSITVLDGGRATDTVTLAVRMAVAVSDGGQGTDAVTLRMRIALAISDGGRGTDAVTLALKMPLIISDGGRGTDAVTEALRMRLTMADGGSGTDSVTVQIVSPSIPIVASDGASATDTATLQVVTPNLFPSGGGIRQRRRSITPPVFEPLPVAEQIAFTPAAIVQDVGQENARTIEDLLILLALADDED